MNLKKKAAVTTVLSGLLLVGAMAPMGHAQGDPKTGPFSAYNVGANQDLDANSAGDRVITYTPNGSDFQKWRLLAPSDKGSLIESVVKRGQCIQSPAGLDLPAFLAPCNEFNPAQRWNFVQEGNATVIETAENPGVVLGATGQSSPSEFKDVTVQNRSNDSNQRWALTAA